MCELEEEREVEKSKHYRGKIKYSMTPLRYQKEIKDARQRRTEKEESESEER